MNFIYNKYFILFLFISFFIKYSYSQTNNLKKGDLEIRFIKDQVEIERGKSFFDILYIKNKTNRTTSFNIQINVPKDWKVIGSSYQKITLTSYSDISIPVRVTLSKNVNGGVGYAVVAVINDEKGSVYNSVYAFVKIPVISKVKIKINKTTAFFNQKALKSNFQVIINNSGNIDEIIGIQFSPDASLTVIKEHEKIKYDNIEIKPGEILHLDYDVKLNEEIDYKKYTIHKLKINFRVKDSLIKKAIWFKYIDWKFKNESPDYKKPINLQFLAANIFGNAQPIYYGRVFGDILLKNQKSIYYSFRNYKRNSSNDLWINSRNEIKYNSKKTTIFLGDYTGNLEHSMYGRGIAVSQGIGKNIFIKGVYTKRLLQNSENYGFSYSQNLKKNLFTEIGGVYVKYPNFNNNSKLLYGKVSANIYKNHILLLFGKSQSLYSQLINNNNFNGWGYRSELSGNYKKFNYKIRSEFGTPYYIGYSYGRMLTYGDLNYNLSNNKFLRLKYIMSRYQPAYFSDSSLYSNRYSTTQKVSTIFGYTTEKNFFLYISPIFKENNTNSFGYIDPNDNFASYTTSIEFGIRKYNKNSDNSFNVSAKYGLTSIYRYPLYLNGISYETRIGEPQFTVAQIRASFKQRKFGINLIYYLGPYNITQQFAYFYSYIFSKSLIVIPYYEKYLLNNKIKVTINGSYVNNFTSKNSRSMLSSNIEWFPGKGWSMHFLNTSSINRVSKNQNTYSTTYFEFGITKSFDIQQPRLKYYDYQAVFYKDLNGNRIHDANEPGVSNVLAEITRANPEQDLKDKNYNGEFLLNELYSNEEGKIEYDNIVEGDYIIKYTPQDIQTEKFESEGTFKKFKANKDTIMYIPFMERNKLFGKISLHRSKHSALGDIPLDNIKITVEGNDKTYSALTDKDGYFEMYIPVSDYYKVKINNIFREHFDLRQEYYIVKFNGYKQFELSFDFDEKERKIHFDESDFLVTDEDEANKNFNIDDVKVIKQTNLRGIIKDANSLLPLHAVVSIYNNKTHELISETASSRRTGVYFTSFFAGDNYNIKVKAKGYWTYTEDLYINQITTFNNVTRDVLLRKMFIDEEIKTENLRFKSGSAELSALAHAELDNLIPVLFLNPDVIIEVDGHTDDMESLSYNGRQLSEQRAVAVADYLEKRGLSKKRIKIKAMSNNDPKSRLDTPEGRAQNRRVSIIVAGF